MKLKNIKCLLAVCLCASALLVGCGQKTDSKTADKSETSSESAQNQSDDIQEASRDVFAMDTYMTVTAYGENAEAAVDAAQAEIERLDALLSTGDADSEIAKLNADGSGYTSSRIMDIYKENGITSGLVNLGGNVQALGTKTDGTKWKIAVQSPDDTEDYLGILSVQDKAVITSGGYERYFEQDGVTYHHIIDPKTGYPAESGLVSVTIVSSDGTLADGLSTSLFIMGEEKAADFWREHKDEFDAILMSDDGTLYVTEGLENDFSTERTVEIIR